MLDLLLQTESMPHRRLRAGDYIYRSGSPCDGNIFIVVEGTIVELDGKDGFKPGSEIEAGAFFGDVEAMSGSEIRLQNLKVKSLSATLAIMDKKALKVLGSLHPEFFLNLLKSAIDHLHQAEQTLLQKKPAENS